jgi:hypothetical protein
MGFSFRNTHQLGNTVSVTLQPDENGFMGRECPSCEAYFKIQPGTGLKGKDLPCHCPYCGHTDSHNRFVTKDQVEHTKSVALRQVTGAILKDLKSMEFDHRPRGGFGIGLSLEVKGSPTPVRLYSERDLETEVICDHCTLRYTIYGVFAFCPDCRTHNSRQILETNLSLVGKQLALVPTLDPELRDKSVADTLGNAVAGFDGFGREICRVNASTAAEPNEAEKVSFQNLARAQKRVQKLFGFDLAAGVTPDEWRHASRSFQKRHLFAHCMGVVDPEYLEATADPEAVLGRKVPLRADEVEALISILAKLGRFVTDHLVGTPPPISAPAPAIPLPPPTISEPLPGFGLTLGSQRLAVLLNKRSPHGIPNDTFLAVDAALSELNVSAEELELIADELEERGWVTLHRSLNGPLAFHRLSATARLFQDTDRSLNGWHTAGDAKRLARAIVETDASGATLEQMTAVLGWPPRRINPAAEHLVEGGLTQGLPGSHGEHAYAQLRVTPRLRRFATQ